MAIYPGSTIGMLGGGQLGRMFTTAARTMGYSVIVLDPDPFSPAGTLANEHLMAAFDDTAALDTMAARCDVITTEFENIPASTLEYLAQSKPVHPSAAALRVAQNRKLEKQFFSGLKLAIAPWVAIESEHDLEQARGFDFPAILKSTTLGYDGKGQSLCRTFNDLELAYRELAGQPCVLEKKINLAKEISIILCRNEAGEFSCFPLAENRHRDGILDVSTVPAKITENLVDEILLAARRIAEGLDYCGVLAVEFFVTTDNQVLVNEIAPRPHNSGHFTLDACDTSQFEQQLRMICGLPSGSCRQHTAVSMLNILGDIWPTDGNPDWARILELKSAKLHLYGKSEARPGRKMGHINCLGNNAAQATGLLEKVRNSLK